MYLRAPYWVHSYFLSTLAMSLMFSYQTEAHSTFMLLYKPVKSIEDIHHLQMDIDTISDWVNCNNLTLNPTKCKTMVISRKRNSVKPHAQFTLNSSPLEQVETFKYLGILLSSDLSWSSHIDFICTKARKLIGLLYRRFYGNVDNHSLLELYSVLVRPHLEYAAPIWDPHFIKDTNKLESVQRFALKMCLKQWDLGYQDFLDLSQLPTLENRRLYLKLCTLYKNYTWLLLLSLQCICTPSK